MEPTAHPGAFEISPGGEGSDTMADVETPLEGSEAVGTRERDGRHPRPKAIPHPTAAERAARGKEARAVAPRSGHGEWEPASDRRDPVELLEEQAATRVPELVPIRYGRMLVSPFTFFRGAAYPMAADLAGAPRTGLEVQLCGDAHLSNFGGFAAPDRRLVFSINDFDETLPGPFEWDVKRLVASFAVAGRDRGFDAKQRRSINRAVTRSYREAIRALRRDVQPRPLVLPHRRRRDRRAGGSAGDREAAEAVRAQRGQGAVEGQPEGVCEAHDDRRRRAQDRERPAAHRADRGDGVGRRTGRARGVRTGSHPLLPAHPERRPPAAARALSLRPLGAQGRRRGQRRHARLDRADARPRRERSAVPAAQGGAGIGARAVPGQELVQQPRPAGRRGPATDAGRQRHHARLDPDDGFRRREPRLLHAPALGRQGLGAGRDDEPAGDDGVRASSAATRSRRRMPAPGTRSRSGAISARATASIARWPRSQRPTPTRTSATTTPCGRPLRPVGSLPRQVSEARIRTLG